MLRTLFLYENRLFDCDELIPIKQYYFRFLRYIFSGEMVKITSMKYKSTKYFLQSAYYLLSNSFIYIYLYIY